MIYLWPLKISTALKDANFHPRLQLLLSNHQICSINVYGYCLHKNKKKRNHNVGIESKATLANTFLMAYTEMIICCFYKLKLCQSIIFLNYCLQPAGNSLEMGGFSHSQGTICAHYLTNLFSPIANEANDFPAGLRTSDCAVPTVSLAWPHIRLWSDVDAVKIRNPD